MTFLELQLRNIGKRNHGQRYTNEQKTMMLAIYKRGPRVYRYVALLFGLPSRRTLCRHSAHLKFQTGINAKLFELLKATASKLAPSDRICTLGWDEMALTHHLSYCTSEDYIDGFVDFGDVRIQDFATHSLTFMLRGISKPFKQPVAYFYSQNLNGIQLADLIKLVIRAVHDSGIHFCISKHISSLKTPSVFGSAFMTSIDLENSLNWQLYLQLYFNLLPLHFMFLLF